MNLFILICKGAKVSSFSITSFANFPISVFSPVSTTIPNARPLITDVLKNAMFMRSLSDVFSFILSLVFSLPMLSPVSNDSFITKFSVFINLKSAGTSLPVSNITMSPITSSSDGISILFPSLITKASIFIRFSNASAFILAFHSCIVPNIPSSIITTNINIPSNSSPTINDSIIDTMSIYTMGLFISFKNISIMVFFLFLGKIFLPFSLSLLLASSFVNPVMFVFNSLNISFSVNMYHSFFIYRLLIIYLYSCSSLFLIILH